MVTRLEVTRVETVEIVETVEFLLVCLSWSVQQEMLWS